LTVSGKSLFYFGLFAHDFERRKAQGLCSSRQSLGFDPWPADRFKSVSIALWYFDVLGVIGRDEDPPREHFYKVDG
jgi:hypothetical protein